MKLFKAVCKVVGIIIVLGLIVLGINERMNAKVNLTKYTFAHPEIPEEFDDYKIMLITDLHNAPFSNMIINHIRNTNPDLIVFAGDMVQLPDYNLNETLKIADAFSDIIPMYAVSGNHETQNSEYWYIINSLEDAGVTCLEDYGVFIKKKDEVIYLSGIRDPEHDILNKKQLAEISGHIKKDIPDERCFSVLLNHRADLYPAIKDSDADLILSGHLHGGIVKLPFVGGVIGNDNGGIVPKYEYGHIKEGDSSSMIVSAGCDKNPKKKRFMNPPEVVLITLDS